MLIIKWTKVSNVDERGTGGSTESQAALSASSKRRPWRKCMHVGFCLGLFPLVSLAESKLIFNASLETK